MEFEVERHDLAAVAGLAEGRAAQIRQPRVEERMARRAEPQLAARRDLGEAALGDLGEAGGGLLQIELAEERGVVADRGERLAGEGDELGQDAAALGLLVLDRLLEGVVRRPRAARSRSSCRSPSGRGRARGCGRASRPAARGRAARRASGWSPPRARPCAG
jgi:hypothetical protein